MIQSLHSHIFEDMSLYEVLIHAAAGCVGLLAIQYAKYVGATAGAEDDQNHQNHL